MICSRCKQPYDEMFEGLCILCHAVENNQLRQRAETAEKELFKLNASMNICVGAAGCGDQSELLGAIDRLKAAEKERDEFKARCESLAKLIACLPNTP